MDNESSVVKPLNPAKTVRRISLSDEYQKQVESLSDGYDLRDNRMCTGKTTYSVDSNEVDTLGSRSTDSDTKQL